MTPRLFRKLAGNAADGNSGAAVLAAMAGLCTNLQAENYFGGNYTFSNVLEGAGAEGFDNGGIYHDADLWLQGVPAGTSTLFRRRILFNLDALSGYVPPGAWLIATRQGMVCTVDNAQSSTFMHITQQGSDSPSQSSRNATFTIDDLGPTGNYGTLALYAYVKAPAAGGPFDCKDLYVGLAANYASWLAGQDSTPEWIANNAQVKAFKDGDLVGMNGGGIKFVTKPSDLVSVTRSYQGTGSRSFGRIAKQCREIGAVYWPVLPFVYEEALFSASVATNSIKRNPIPGVPMTLRQPGDAVILNGAYFQDNVPHGGLKGFQRYYIVNMLDADTWQVSLTPGGALVTVTQDFLIGDNVYNALITLALDPYAVYLAIAQQIRAVYPGGRIAPQCTLEPWNNQYFLQAMFQISSVMAGQPGNQGAGYAWRLHRMWKAFRDAGFSRSQILYSVETQGGAGAYGFNVLGGALDYVSTDPDFYFGKTTSQIMDAMSTASYASPFDAGGNQMGSIELMIAGAKDFSASDWSVCVRRGIDHEQVLAAEFRATLDAKRPNTPLIMYEGEPSDQALECRPGTFAFMDKTVTAVNTGSPGSLTVATPFGGAWIPDLPITPLATGSPPGGLTGQPYFFAHPSSTTTTLVLSATRGGSPVAITSAGSGTISVTVKGQQVLDLATSYEAYKASAQRALDMAYFLQKVVGAEGYKSRNFAIYSMVGNSNKGTAGLRYYQEKRSDSHADNPTTTFLKSYTGWVTTP